MINLVKKLWRRRWRHLWRIVAILALLQLLALFFSFAVPGETGTDQMITYDVKDSAREATSLAVTLGSPTTAPDKKAEVRKRMESRLQRITEFCNSFKSNADDPLKNKHVVVSSPNRFLHCPVTKAASTFWFRFLHTLKRSSAMKSPYSFPLQSNMITASTSLSSYPNSSSNKAAFVKSAFRNVFIRDPFSRMLSAYVDKVFAPNPTYWKLWGKHAIKYFRKNADHKALSCGSDVTFAEVMSYANMKLRMGDIHFLPVSKVCQPCTFHYDFVGKMETFHDDVVYLAQTLNLSIVEYLQSEEFLFDYNRDAIEDSINSPFAWLKDILPCMSKQEMGLRIWRKLQIRGMISRRILFPYSSESFERTTAEELIEKAMDAHMRSTDREELRQQKRDAFLEAYSSVDMRAMTRLMSAFKADFELFGYDDFPSKVYNIPGDITRGAFDWSKEWTA